MKKNISKKWRWTIGTTASMLTIVPLIAVSAVACAQPSLKQNISNQQIVNALQNYFVKNPNLLNGSETVNQQSNIFLSSIYYISWSEILNYLRAELKLKTKTWYW